ncbi:MAG: hypothetical protein JOZ10_14640 [Acidobacteria bacterium]|nr:hypothetical protein [Acidobacteriota bacterium]
MTTSEIDDSILSVLGERWKKVARVVVEVAQRTGGTSASQSDNYETISQRIEALVGDGRLEAQGNIKNWRFSEVRRSESGHYKSSQ